MAATALRPMTMAAAASGRQAWRQVMRAPASSTQKPQLGRQSEQLLQRRAASSSSSSPAAAHSIIQRPTAPAVSPRSLPARNTSTTATTRGPKQQQQQRSYSSSSQSNNSSTPPPPPPPRGKDKNNLKFWPFLVVIALGSSSYILLVNRRKEMPAVPPPVSSKTSPTFSPDDVTVLFVLGGPGAGKGTQCARLVKDFGFTHLSAGDLLRAEQTREGSEFGALIRDCIKDGSIVPMEVTVQLLENAMKDTIATSGGVSGGAKARFLIDGFPRKMDQALKFEEAVCLARLVLFFDCPEDEMERRLLERGKTSGRSDDNADSIRKRFRTFVETSMPVVDHYEKEGRVVKVDATPTPDAVYRDTQARLTKVLGDNF